jgi:tyrosine aminotransferase
MIYNFQNNQNLAAGYLNACGLWAARDAVANEYNHYATKISTNNDALSSNSSNVKADDVVIASGCTGALDMVFGALLESTCDENTTSLLLVPQPGFPIYQSLIEAHGANVLQYRLIPGSWECDMEHLEELIQNYHHRIRGLLINNPSNPTGGVFSLAHLQNLVDFCDRYTLPVISDEIYGDLTFDDAHRYIPFATVVSSMGSHVPVITTSGVSTNMLYCHVCIDILSTHSNVAHHPL